MHTLIAYTTKYGATREAATRIAARLPGETTLHDLDTVPSVDLAPYDTVVIGCSVYMGKPRRAARLFGEKHMDTLLQKRVGLYLCCIQDVEKPLADQLKLAFPGRLLEEAVAVNQVGGIVDFTKLKTMDRFIMNLIMGDLRKKTGNDIVSTMSDERIQAFCNKLAGQE